MYIKEQIDNDAEREGIALSKAGRLKTATSRRIRLRKNNDYNKEIFNKLFVNTKG